jgi:GNAT superfamily N-acetyltransferase
VGLADRHRHRHRSLTIEIRLAREDDLPELPRIELSAAQKFVGQDVPPDLLREVAPADAYRPHQRAGSLWVVDDAGTPVAFLAARVEGARLHVDELDVRLERQGHGLGRRLLAHAADWARAQGLSTMSLTPFRHIPWNAPFYASVGFRDWPEADAPATVRQALMNERNRGLPHRCAMVMDL